jgi:hypothetical protein
MMRALLENMPELLCCDLSERLTNFIASEGVLS